MVDFSGCHALSDTAACALPSFSLRDVPADSRVAEVTVWVRGLVGVTVSRLCAKIQKDVRRHV